MKLSIASVLVGADKTSHSVNKVLYGVFEKFLKYFDAELDAIDHAAGITDKKNPLRVVFTKMITEFEANERRTYATVAFNQRGRVPLSIKPGDMQLQNLGNTDWVDNDSRKTPGWVQEQPDPNIQQPTASQTPSVSRPLARLSFVKKMSAFRRWGDDDSVTHDDSDTDDSNTGESANQLEPIPEDKFTSRDAKIIGKVKDVYHNALHELLEVCDESLLGLTSIIELYEIIRNDKELQPFDYSKLIAKTDDLSISQYSRIIFRAAENLKRSITRKYFYEEVRTRLQYPQADVANLRKLLPPVIF